MMEYPLQVYSLIGTKRLLEKGLVLNHVRAFRAMSSKDYRKMIPRNVPRHEREVTIRT
jgi:hypothetical protein